MLSDFTRNIFGPPVSCADATFDHQARAKPIPGTSARRVLKTLKRQNILRRSANLADLLTRGDAIAEVHNGKQCWKQRASPSRTDLAAGGSKRRGPRGRSWDFDFCDR